MPKPLIQLFLALLLAGSSFAQETVVDSIPINKDSIEKELDDFLKLYDSLVQPKTYFLIGAGVGNTQFSVKNVALNAQQYSSNISLTPNLAYYHKSGLSFSYSSFILLEEKKAQLLQHALSFSYDQIRKENYAYGLSYTRFAGKKEFVNSSSPYDNDFLFYAEGGNKRWRGGAMTGYSGGRYRETLSYLDSQRIKLPVRPDSVTFYFFVNDTSSVRVRSFSFIPYLKYELDWGGFGKKDYFSAQATVMLIGTKNSVMVNSKGTIRQRFVPGRSRAYSETDSQNEQFKFQSLGMQLDVAWYIRKFYINPQIYFDYYLLSSDYKFSTLFTLQTGFMF